MSELLMYDGSVKVSFNESDHKKHHHKGAGSAEYCAWQNMKARCNRPTHPQYAYYGGRGINICERWQACFCYFLADMGRKPDSERYTLERVNNNRGYSPENCKWATTKEQILNRRLNKSNTSGHRGVSYNKKHQQWHAYIKVDYKRINLGYFTKVGEAIKARTKAEVEYGY